MTQTREFSHETRRADGSWTAYFVAYAVDGDEVDLIEVVRQTSATYPDCDEVLDPADLAWHLREDLTERARADFETLATA